MPEDDYNKGSTGMTENGPSQMRRKKNVIKKWRGALRQWVIKKNTQKKLENGSK
jgi:hypothetical protein